ncbi:AraC family transcriptional regulator [Paenibacillus sp. alder61]|uniref:AraC family transcriptional regulator n=1 Tax=Paenibacillus sp. alder61 TaxID=2862948 RepID=UPI001CD65E04|nr:AraC family transcriptional regulator [Paenibacillus sp. alder61]MCA1291550.1 AraC family transcriptional regulator [Paenibacillus sp. alder61]
MEISGRRLAKALFLNRFFQVLKTRPKAQIWPRRQKKPRIPAATPEVCSAHFCEACRMLRDTDWTIEEVGAHVGYSDIHYFSRLFSANKGISPRAYRKLSRIL